jgi:formate/nitrite transporter FocA (FNT family)
VLGNLVGGLSFTGLTLYATHLKTKPKRVFA